MGGSVKSLTMDRGGSGPQQQQHRRGYSMGSGVREKDEDLALFQDMRQRERTHYLYPSTDDQVIEASLSTKFGGLSHPNTAPPAARKGVGADLLNSDADKNDYDWLLTPPGTPLFPSLDLDSPAYAALQQGVLINRSLSAIKTSRATTNRADPPAKIARGNPSPTRRPSTPQNGPSSNSRSRSLPAATTSNANVRPATPTRSSTPNTRASSSTTRPATPTRQNSTPAGGRPLTPQGIRPPTPTARPATPTNKNSTSSNRPSTPTSGRPSTPTLRRSSSSPTSGRPYSAGSNRGNASPTQSTASSASTRGVSPVRGNSRGTSPARGPTPMSARGQSSSPRAYPVAASDDIPPNLRTTSDRPSSAQRRAAEGGSAGQSPDGGNNLQRQTISPRLNHTYISPSKNLDRSSRASSDSESSFDASSQSGVSSRGFTPERSGYGRRMSTGNEDIGRPTLKTRRSHSSHFGPSLSKKSLDSAAREMQRGTTGAFRPLMSNSSISTFYSSRASTLLRRPLTPSSTASSEQGASVTPDTDGEEEVINEWGLRDPAAPGHSPQILVLDKEAEKSTSKTQENGTLVSQDINVGDNEEVSSRRHMEPTEAELKERPLFMRADEVHHFKNFENSGSGRVDFDNVRDRVESSSISAGELCPSPMIDHQNRDFQRKISGDVVFQETRNDSQKLINAGVLSNAPERFQCGPDAHHLANPGDKRFTPDRFGSLDSTGSREPGLGSFIGATPDPSGVVLNDGGGVLTAKEDSRTSLHEQGHSLSGLERVRDKLRHLQNPVEPHNLDAAEKQDAGETVTSNSNGKVPSQEPDGMLSTIQEASLEQSVIVNQEERKVCKCSHMEHPGETCKEPACSCGMSETSAPKMVTQKQTLVETPHGSKPGSKGMEGLKPNVGLSKGLDWAREKDIWYIYRHSSDYEVPVVGFAHTKVEIPLQTLAKDDRSRVTGVSRLKEAVGFQEDQTLMTEAPREQEFDSHSFKVENPIRTEGEEHKNAVQQEKALQKEQVDLLPSDKLKVEDYTVTGKSVLSETPKVEALSQQPCEFTGTAGKMNALEVMENVENHVPASSCQQSTDGADSMVTAVPASPTLGSKSKENFEKLDAKCPGKDEELKQGSESFLGAKADVQARGRSSYDILPLSENWVNDSRPVDVSTASNIYGEAFNELARGAQWDPEMQKAISWEKEKLIGLESQQRNRPELASTLVSSNIITCQSQLQPQVVLTSNRDDRKHAKETDYEVPVSNLTANVAFVSEHIENHDLLVHQGPFQYNPQTSSLCEANGQSPEVLVPTARVRDTDPISAKTESNGSRSLEKTQHEDQELTAREFERRNSQNGKVASANLHEYRHNAVEEEVFIDIPVDPCGGVLSHNAATPCKQPNHTKTSPDLSGMIEISQSSPKPLDLKNGRTPQELETCETAKVENLAGSLEGNPGTKYTPGHEDSKESRQVDHEEQDRICSQLLDKNEISGITPIHTTAHHCWDEFKNPDVGSHAVTRVLHVEKPSMCTKGYEASFGGGSARKNGTGLQNSFSQSNFSKSSAQTPTSGSSIDLSRSTDTMSSCPSNASWEDPHYVLHPGFWNSKSSTETVRAPDLSATAPSPVKLCAVEIADKGLRNTSADDVAYTNGGMQMSSHVKDGSVNRDKNELDSGEELFDYDFDYLGAKDKVPQVMEAPIIAKMVVPPTVVEEKQRWGTKGPKVSTNVKGAALRDIDGDVIVEKAVEFKGAKPPKIEAERVATRKSSRDIELPEVRKISNPKVVQSPVKEEIVENSESPGPNARKHLSSFKFGRKKTFMELERDSSPMLDTGTPNHSEQVSARCKLSSQTAKPVVVPQLTKGRSVGAASPARPVKIAESRPAQAETWSADSKMPEELSIQSRFSNITVRSGSVSENFDWGRSSLEETSSRSGSSSGAVTTPMAVPRSMTLAEATDRILFCSRIVHDIVYRAAELAGDQQDEDREPATCSSQQRTPKAVTSSLRENDMQREATSSFPLSTPSNSTYEILNLSEPDCRNPVEAHALEPGGWTGLDQKYSPETGIAVTARRSLNYLPKESLDKLGEKLERLEKFGSQASRSPKAHFMSLSQEARSDKEEPSMHPAETVRLRTSQEGLEDLNKSKCRCTIL